jgi:thiol-disulfide isomerase/thioredoxin
MRKRLNIRSFLFFTALLDILGLSAQSLSPFTISPEIFSQGDTVQVVYRPKLAGHNDSAGVRASVYLFRNFSWEGYDLPIKKTDTGWVIPYIVPSGTAMVAFHFLIGDSVDKGGRYPYAGLVHERPGKMADGAYMEWGLFRNKQKFGKVSEIVPASSVIEPNVTMIWVGKEWGNSLVVRNLFPGMARAIKAAYPDKADSTLRKMASYLIRQPDLTEKQWIYVQKVYSEVLRDRPMADSLQKVIVTKFPGGLLDRVSRLTAIYIQRDSAKKADMSNRFFTEFPLSKFPLDDYLDPEAGDITFGSHLYIAMTMRAFNRHQWEELAGMLRQSPFQYLDYFYEHFVMYPFRTDKPSITPAEALSLSSLMVDEILRRVKDPDPVVSGRGSVAPAEWFRHVMTQDSGIFGYHLGLMNDNGDIQKGWELAEKLKPYAGVTSISFNENYVRLLHKLKKDDDAIPFIKAAVYAGTATPEMLGILQEDYRRSKGTTVGFLNYYQSLRSETTLQKEHAWLEKSLISVPGVTFNLPDMNDRSVDLAKLRGKIVVLDFWATWCFPCKSAMPGMQLAVNKYKQDTSVAFYFISTLEERPDYKKSITTFLKEKQYDFTVLCDRTDPATGHTGLLFSQWAPILKMNGIPQKVIIDQNGVVRWVTSGFYGSVIQVADEVSYVIDLLKKERG